MARSRRPPRRAALALFATVLLAALPVVGPRSPTATAAAGGAGYWLAGSDGSVLRYGDAGDLGSLHGSPPARPVVGMSPTPTGAGYWLVAADGGIFAFGDAHFQGSTGATPLNRPIVGMAATPTGAGYWLVAADGGIFAFGDAHFHGSTGATPLNRPIVGMAATPTGQGYWFVASDGGAFNFGDAPFLGSAAGRSGAAGTVGMAAVPASLPAPATSATAATAPGPTETSATTTTTTTGSTPAAGPAFQIGLVGDSGYMAGQPGIFDRVVDDMNRFPLAFVVHDGDFKDPQSPCGDDRFESVRASFDRSVAPFVYTPGDNEWMDCATARTPMDPLQRLGELREMFFAADESRGVNRMPLTTQRQSGYPENARWTKEGVVFVTINAPGPNDDVANADESNARRTANVAWLQAAFDAAEATAAPGVMVVWQVDPWQPLFRKTWTYLLDVLKARTVAFGKPVVLVHGDTHVYRIDKGGWADGDGTMQHAWTGVSNFTRVETYASGVASPQSSTPPEPKRWIRATVDPSDPAVFTFTTETAG